MVFIFQFINGVYYIDWFADIEESLHSWDKAHLAMMYDFFNMLYQILYIEESMHPWDKAHLIILLMYC